MVSKITAFAAGIVLGLMALKAEVAQAFTLYDFTVTWADGVVSSGQLAIDASTPTIEVSDYTSSLSYRRRQWNFVDFTMIHRGRTYTLADLYGGYISQYDFPETSEYFPAFGNTIDYLYAEVRENGSTAFTVHRVDFSPIAQYEDYGPSRDYINNLRALDTTWTARSLNPPVEEPTTPMTSSAVPEPTALTGLTLAGIGLLARRRWQQQRQLKR